MDTTADLLLAILTIDPGTTTMIDADHPGTMTDPATTIDQGTMTGGTIGMGMEGGMIGTGTTVEEGTMRGTERGALPGGTIGSVTTETR